MARDETAREPDPEPLLDRRAYLRLAGATAVAVAVAGASESADAADHDSTPADETRPSRSSRGDRSETAASPVRSRR
ncbi:hypothetical protein [Halorussus halobius]|uniref:hypothetical protein n=1 Tax=Halorussus halobius TaxID=1710537 RepID=UPI001091DB24|nr:hypothetical protein [Halorussus halobius]